MMKAGFQFEIVKAFVLDVFKLPIKI